MNLLDVLIIIILGYSIYTTIRKGFLRIVSEFFAFILAGWAAYTWNKSLAIAFSSGAVNDDHKVGGIIAFIVIWILVFGLVNLIAYVLLKILDKSFISLILKPFNILASIMMGFLKGIIISLFVVIPLMILAIFSSPMQQYVHHSLLVRVTQQHVTGLVAKILPAPQPVPTKIVRPKTTKHKSAKP